MNPHLAAAELSRYLLDCQERQPAVAVLDGLVCRRSNVVGVRFLDHGLLV